MRNGIAYPLPPLALPTDGTDGGLLPTPVASNTKAVALQSGGRAPRNFLLPTPRANDAEKRGKIANDPRNGLPAAAMYWPTPTARDHKGQGMSVARRLSRKPDNLCSMTTLLEGSGSLNPTWVEWLMGFPLGWTDLDA